MICVPGYGDNGKSIGHARERAAVALEKREVFYLNAQPNSI